MDLEQVNRLAVLKNCIRFLRITFIFPSDDEITKVKDGEYYNYKHAIMSTFTLYFSIGAFLHMVMNIKNKSMAYVDRDVGTILSYHGTSLFLSRYVNSIKHMLTVYKKLSDFKTFGKPKDFEKRSEWLNRYAVYYFIYHSVFIFILSVYPLFQIETCEEINKKMNWDEICGLMGSFWLPFDYDFFPWKDIVFAYQFITMFVVYDNAGAVSYVITESVEHVVMRFHHVAQKFQEVIKEKNPRIRRQQFLRAVRYHQVMLDIASRTSKSFSPCMIVHLVLTAPVLGFTFFRIISEFAGDALCLFVCWTISTILVCNAGQRLGDATEYVGKMLYQTEWYNVEAELQRDIHFVIHRVSKPTYLVAGPFGFMDYTMLMLILKTSYSYVTLLMRS